MYVDIITDITQAPLRLDVAQFVVRNSQGTIVIAAADFGFKGAIKVSKVGDADFAETLRSIGINETVRITPVALPLAQL